MHCQEITESIISVTRHTKGAFALFCCIWFRSLFVASEAFGFEQPWWSLIMFRNAVVFSGICLRKTSQLSQDNGRVSLEKVPHLKTVCVYW